MITKEAIEAGVAAFESAFNGSPNSTEMVTTILTAAFAAMPAPAGVEVETVPPSTHVEAERLRRMVERRDEFIISQGLWDEFKEVNAGAK